jgi:hypothetical protein
MSRRTLAVALAAVAVVGAAAVAPTAASAADAAPSADSPGIHYAITEPACGPAQPGGATCFALERVPVTAGTAGAEPFTITPGAPVGPAGGYTPNDLLTAYGLTGLPADAGSGQTVAIVDAFDDPNALVDLNHFDANYGLPAETASTFTKINQTGGAAPLPQADAGWAVEESLDLDAVRGICHNCKILLVEANSTGDDDLSAAVTKAAALGATEITNSYGGGSVPMSSAEIAAYNQPGVVVTAGAGDDGWGDWDQSPHASDIAEFPSSSPDVVAVGGTSLKLNADATRNVEAVWNEDGRENSQSGSTGGGATGGGCSKHFAPQPWQVAIAGFANAGCGAHRLTTDVSALADDNTGYDIYDSYGRTTGWLTAGGTSLASPLIAAMWALAGGAHGVAYPSLTLYGHANQSMSAFYDVTQGYTKTKGVQAVGGSDYCDGDVFATCKAVHGSIPSGDSCLTAALPSNGECAARIGFDGPSGVGTPTGLADFTPLTPVPLFEVPAGVTPGTGTSFGASATDPLPGASIASYSWSWGDGSAGSLGASPSHTFAVSGTYTVSLTATDIYGQVGTVSHDVTVAPAGPVVPSISGVSPSSSSAAGGTSVTITGTGFTGTSKVLFGTGAPATIAAVTPMSITVTSPAHAAGVVNLRVTTPVGTSATTSADVFTYTAAPPTITAVSPKTGSADGGTSVTITGTAFTGVKTVLFGNGFPGTVGAVTATSITVTSPAHVVGAVNIKVTTASGTSATTAADVFTYQPAPPVITGLDVKSGPIAGGTEVTITGTGFTAASAVAFGNGSPGTVVTVTATSITATSPAHAKGAVNIRVTTASGESAVVPADTYTYK